MVANTLNQYTPDSVSSPGETLRESIDALGMTSSELAASIGITDDVTEQLIRGTVSITPEIALKLERALGVPAVLWNSLESNYLEFLARADRRAER